MTKTNWLNYWDKKNIWTESELWKKNNEIFFQKTSNIFKYNNNQTVLDIGCGNGDFAYKISSKVDQVYCLETSQEYVNICKNKFSNRNNVKVLKLSDNYTDLSFIKNIKFSIIVANSVVQHYRSQQEIVDLVKSVKKISSNNAQFLISDMEVSNKKITTYIKLIYNSIINGYFTSLVKMGLKLATNNKYSKTKKNLQVLFIDPDKLINDLSSFVKEVTEIKEHITVNVNRKHLLIKL